MPSETLFTLIPFLLKFGIAAYEAIKSGDRTRTVGEIFDGMGSDLDEIKRLEREAEAEFARGA